MHTEISHLQLGYFFKWKNQTDMTVGKNYSLKKALLERCVWVCVCGIITAIIYQNNHIITIDCRSAFQASLFLLFVKLWEKGTNPPHSGYLHCATLIGSRSPSVKHTCMKNTHIHRAHGNRPARRVTLRNNANRSSSLCGQAGNNKTGRFLGGKSELGIMFGVSRDSTAGIRPH